MENGNQTSGNHHSYWIDSVAPLTFAPLDKNLGVDVVVVGGGIAGITIAYSLVKSGKKVVLVEDGAIGSGETGRSSAHLVCALDDRYYELERMYGEEKTKMIADSHRAAIDFIERASKYNEIECEFERVDGYLFLDPTDKPESLEKELKAARKAGVEVVELPVMPVMNDAGPALKFYNQAQFHPMKYLKGMANAIVKMGGQIYTDTHAAKIDNKGITTDTGFTVTADHIVVATNSPVNNKYMMHLKQYAYRTYVIGARVKKGSIPKALFWDTGDRSVNKEIPPYHYIRLQALNDEYDLLLCGGEDHPTGIADDKKVNEEDRYSVLEYWLRQRFTIEDIIYQWSGQVMEPMDSLGYIGRNSVAEPNVYIVTGDSGNGLTHGTIAGLLIPDLIMDNENEWEDIYSPARFKLLSAGKTFFKEFVGGLFAYIKNKPHDVKSVEVTTIKTGEAKIVEFEGKKMGAYRAEDGTLHMVSGECTHLGCMVKWNNDEKSWDCPCHGSRFNHDGKVLNGPANKDLPYLHYTDK